MPEYWWVALRGRKLHDGKISSFDESQQKWLFVCDSDQEPYAMAYPGVLEYADKGASTYSDFDRYLTAEPVLHLGDEEVAEPQEPVLDLGDEEVAELQEPVLDPGRTIDPIPWGDTQGNEAKAKLTEKVTYLESLVKKLEERVRAQTPISPANWSKSAKKLKETEPKKLKETEPKKYHQSIATICKNDGGHCQYEFCPGKLRNNIRKRSYPTKYQCYECTIKNGYPVWLCNTTKKMGGKYMTVLCHTKHHLQLSKLGWEECPRVPTEALNEGPNPQVGTI